MFISGASGRVSRVCASNVNAAPFETKEDSWDDRVKYIANKSQLDFELDIAGDRLVVLELMAETQCETGLFEAEAEDQWTPQTEQERQKMDVCSGIRHAYVEMAADSRDSRFLAVMVRTNITHRQVSCTFRNPQEQNFAGGGVQSYWHCCQPWDHCISISCLLQAWACCMAKLWIRWHVQ